MHDAYDAYQYFSMRSLSYTTGRPSSSTWPRRSWSRATKLESPSGASTPFMRTALDTSSAAMAAVDAAPATPPGLGPAPSHSRSIGIPAVSSGGALAGVLDMQRVAQSMPVECV